MSTVGLVGVHGWIGGALARRLAEDGHHVVALPRVPLDRAVGDAAADYHVLLPPGLDLAVNAAGRAAPGSGPDCALWAANAILPEVIRAALPASVPLIHLSSAAACGRSSLHERPVRETACLSPYARSKTEGEHRLLAQDRPVTILRVGSIVGRLPSSTAALRLLARAPILPVERGGTPHATFITSDLLADVVSFLARQRQGGTRVALVVHPDLTLRLLLSGLNPQVRLIELPPGVVHGAFGAAYRLGWPPWLYALLRRAEIMVRGQDLERAAALRALGFPWPPVADLLTGLSDVMRAH